MSNNKTNVRHIIDLSGRTALVTRGSRSLGSVMARIYAEHGADIMIAAETRTSRNAAANEIGEGLSVRVE